MKILLVDDEEDIRKVGCLSLEGVGGFDTRVAADATEALAMLDVEHPDVILMDMMMPGMDGLETMIAIHAKPALQAIPIIFMTAKVQPHEVQQYLDAGAIGVIEKPFDPMTLPDDIIQIVEQS